MISWAGDFAALKNVLSAWQCFVGFSKMNKNNRLGTIGRWGPYLNTNRLECIHRANVRRHYKLGLSGTSLAAWLLPWTVIRLASSSDSMLRVREAFV